MTTPPKNSKRPSLRPGAYSFKTDDLAAREEHAFAQQRAKALGKLEGGPEGEDLRATVPRPPTAGGAEAPSGESTLPDHLQDEVPAAAGPDTARSVATAGASPTGRRAMKESVVVDPRLHDVERLVDRGQWDQLLALLDTDGEHAQLLPPMGLLCAIAAKEAVRRPAWAKEADQLAIESMAVMLGVRSDSPVARIVAKRMLRKHTALREQPRRSTAWIVVTGAIVAGTGIGWLITYFMF